MASNWRVPVISGWERSENLLEYIRVHRAGRFPLPAREPCYGILALCSSMSGERLLSSYIRIASLEVGQHFLVLVVLEYSSGAWFQEIL